MKHRAQYIFITLLLGIIFAPQAAFADGFLTPMRFNHGSYKGGNNDLHALVGNMPKVVLSAKKIKPMEADKIVQLSIMLPWNNYDELDELLWDLMNPKSPKFRKYLTQEQFLARFAPTLVQVEKAKSYLTSQGFTVEAVAPNRSILKVSGPVKAINATFHTEMDYYLDKNGEPFYAPSYELQIDKTFKIKGVAGLENHTKLRHAGRGQSRVSQSEPNISALTCLDVNNNLTPIGIAESYSLSYPDPVTSTTPPGTGQNIAIVEFDGYTPSDITTYYNLYFNTFTLWPPGPHITNILIDGATNTPDGNAFEVTLDIEMVLAMAPGANLLVYIAPNTAQGVLDLYLRVATDNSAKIITSSWGSTEDTNTTSYLEMENELFKQMVAQGQTFFNASGDRGSFDDETTLSVLDPASQPLVVGVGGTTLSVNVNAGVCTYVDEVAWSNDTPIPDLEGGGGGISSIWPLPYWQNGIAGINEASTTFRNVPDVSLNAGPSLLYSVFFENILGGGFGTSFAAPLWSAFMLLVNEARQNRVPSLNGIGFFNPILYQIGQSVNYANTFHDVTIGTNSFDAEPYSAGIGYDLATGWGSFRGDNLLDLLSGIDSPPPPCLLSDPDLSVSCVK